jgi:hypothetical protein
MPPPTQAADPIREAHASRSGNRQTPPLTLDQRDANTLLTEHFFPPPQQLTNKDLTNLEDMREEQQRHITQLATARATQTELRHKFSREDQQHEAALAAAFANGTAPPTKDKRTPPEQRRALLEGAETSSRLAYSAAHEWAQEALTEARTLQDDWLTAISTSQAPTRQRIEELNQELNLLKAQLRADTLLETWVTRLDNPTPGLVLAYGHLQAVPGAITADPTDTEEPPTSPHAQIAWRQARLARGLPVD